MLVGTCSCGARPWPHVRESDLLHTVSAARARHILAWEPHIRLAIGPHEYDTLRKTRSGEPKLDSCNDDARAPLDHPGMARALKELLARVRHGTDLVPQGTPPDRLTIVEWRHRLFAVLVSGRLLVRPGAELRPPPSQLSLLL